MVFLLFGPVLAIVNGIDIEVYPHPVSDASEILARFPGFHHPAGPPES